MKDPEKIPATAPTDTEPGEASAASSCSALASALALVDFGPCKSAGRPQDWINVAAPMCEHCEGLEDVNLAAARIIAREYRKIVGELKGLQRSENTSENHYGAWVKWSDVKTIIEPNVRGQPPPTETQARLH